MMKASITNGGKPPAMDQAEHYPFDHPAAKMAREGKRLPIPVPAQHAVDHARKFGHLTEKQLAEIEAELITYSREHRIEIESMRLFRRTLPIDPGLWNEEDRKRFDARYNINVKKIHELSDKSKAVIKKWRVPPMNVDTRETTWVLDEEHLSMISEHLWKLAQKGQFSEKERKAFRADLDLYIEFEQKILEQRVAAKAAWEKKKANEAAKAAPAIDSGTKNTQTSAKSPKGAGNKKISEEARQAHQLRKRLERAVFGQRMRREL